MVVYTNFRGIRGTFTYILHVIGNICMICVISMEFSAVNRRRPSFETLLLQARSFLALAGTPVQGQRGLEKLCQWPMFRGGIIKGFRSDQKQEQYDLCNLTVAYTS